MESWKKELYLMHVGVSKMNGAPGRGSGRYPLGSGDRPRALFRLFGKKSAPSISKKKISYTPEEFEAKKNEAIEKGDLEFIKDNIDRFSSNDIRNANNNYITRTNLDSNYDQLMKKKKPDVFTVLDKFNNKVSSIIKTAENVEKGAKILSKLFNVDLGEEKEERRKKKKKND